MNQEKVLIFSGFTEEEAEVIKEAARIWAERVRIAVEEAVAAFARILSQIGPPDLEALDDIREELEENGRESRARRRKMERSRAQAIEQRYRAEIHRVERERFCRRIYKPP